MPNHPAHQSPLGKQSAYSVSMIRSCSLVLSALVSGKRLA